MIKKEILQDLNTDDLTPPPYWIMTGLPPSAPPGPESALMPHPGPGEVPAAAIGRHFQSSVHGFLEVSN